MPFLHCSSCRFTVSQAAARSPYQNCPRCLLREGARRMMVPGPAPSRRFNRTQAMVRISEAKTRLSGPLQDPRSA